LELSESHLGVTEAGDGEDGRIKSAIGIGSLLCDGLGDTIRVSLTEDSPREIEVLPRSAGPDSASHGGSSQFRRVQSMAVRPLYPLPRRNTPENRTKRRGKSAAVNRPCAWSSPAPPGTNSRRKISPKADVKPEAVYEDLNIFEVDPAKDFDINCDTQLRHGEGWSPVARHPGPFGYWPRNSNGWDEIIRFC